MQSIHELVKLLSDNPIGFVGPSIGSESLLLESKLYLVCHLSYGYREAIDR